ncbi:MAG: SpoIIE family protein phosphatase [Acetatifactor sp.]|nr:SpoIIE family protein phosphatase [Acetatifactor sp.]
MNGRERGVSMAGKRKKIGCKVNGLLLAMVSLSIFLTGGISIYSLYSMKQISVDSSRMLGQTAADDAEQALEEMAEEKLRDVAVEKAAYIEEKFRAVEAYVLGIAELAGQIYDHPERYPDRMVDLPVPGSKSLAAQLLWSKRLSAPTPEEQAALPKTVETGDAVNTEFFEREEDESGGESSGREKDESGGNPSRTKGEETDPEQNKPAEGDPEQGFLEWERMLGVLTCASEEEKGELRKLGNIQNLLEQYNSHNDMVSSTYLATESGWMIQADYISFSKYEKEPVTAEDGKTLLPMSYEADEREWYVLAKEEPAGQVIYTDVIKDVHRGEDCIVCASPVYHNGKIVAVAGVGSYLETVNNAVLDTIIGQEGYAFLVNRKGQVMVSGKRQGETAACAEQNLDLRQSANQELAEAAKRMVAGHSGYLQLTVDGQEVCMAYAPLNRLGWSFVTVIGVAEVIAPARQSQDTILSLTDYAAQEQDGAIRQMLAYLVAVLAAVTFLVSLTGTWFSHRLTEPIRRLTGEVARIDGGNLDYRIQMETGDEVEDLGNAFNGMADQIQKYIKNLALATADKERIRTEIQVASRLQADMLPNAEGAFAERTEFSLYASMTPAKGVGGDFYDFFLLDEDHLALVMADVSGKGVPAALFMVVSRTLIRSHVAADIPLEQVMEEINDSLCDNNKNGMFVTAWIGILVLSTGKLSFVNAGHCRPLIRRQDGTCVYEDSLGGFVLAGMEDTVYHGSWIRLRQGDTLLLYTDGVTEATNCREELYGEQRLLAAAKSSGGCPPKELLNRIWRDVDSFQKDAEQFDDITMMAVVYHGKGFAEKAGRPVVESIREFSVFAEDVLAEKGVSLKTILKIQMAVDELLSNICYYSGAGEMTLAVRVEESEEVVEGSADEEAEEPTYKSGDRSASRRVTLIIEDDGIPYNPLERPDPDVEELLEKRTQGGLGIYLVKKRMDQIEYEYKDGMNRLTLRKWDI